MATEHQIVGIDGSPGSASALAWAAANVERFGPIRPVVAWRYPWWAVDAVGPGPVAVPPTDEELHAEAARRAEGVLATVPADDRLDLLTVRSPAGPGLVSVIEPSTTLLVVGSRGRGAGPSKLTPDMWNPLPWQGHLKRPSTGSQLGAQSRWVQTARRA